MQSFPSCPHEMIRNELPTLACPIPPIPEGCVGTKSKLTDSILPTRHNLVEESRMLTAVDCYGIKGLPKR